MTMENPMACAARLPHQGRALGAHHAAFHGPNVGNLSSKQFGGTAWFEPWKDVDGTQDIG